MNTLLYSLACTWMTVIACADPGIFVRGGGGVGPGQFDKKSSDNVFCSPQLILQKSKG